MTEVERFTFPTTGHSVRTLLVDGEPWFVAADVTEILGYANGRMAIAALPERMKGSVTIADGTPGNPNRTIIISPTPHVSGPSVTASARAEQAAAPTTDLSPTRKGAGPTRCLPVRDKPREGPRPPTVSTNPAPTRPPAQSNRCHTERKSPVQRWVRNSLSNPRHHPDGQSPIRPKVGPTHFAGVGTDHPAVITWDELAEASGDYAVREAALILGRDPRITTGQKRLFAYLRDIGWIDRHNVPYQRHVEAGRVAIRTRTYEHPNRGEDVATAQVRITPKGLGELHRLLGGSAHLPALISEEVRAA